MSTKPTRESVMRVVSEFDLIGSQPFLDKYEKGFPPDRFLIRIAGSLYPLKAIWVAAHEPPGNPSKMDYRKGIRQLRELGFIDVVAVGEENRPPIQPPTSASVRIAMQEFRELGSVAFLNKYTDGNRPKSKYVREGAIDYPLKALFAAAHTPSARHRHFGYVQAQKDVADLGFTVVTLRALPAPYEPEVPRELTVMEGRRVIREVKTLIRHRGIVQAAKAASKPLLCEACGFDFETFYGPHGRDFIEAHHIDPIGNREGVNKPTGIEDFAMLCANCHRMLHYGPTCLTVGELKAMIRRR